MGKNLKSFRIVFNIVILLITAILCTYNMFAWYTGNTKTKINDIGLGIVNNTKGNIFSLNTSVVGENEAIPLKPGEYSILNYEFKYVQAEKLLIYLKENGLTFLDTEATGDDEIKEFGRTKSDRTKLMSYYAYSNNSNSRFNTANGMKFTEIIKNGNDTNSMTYLENFLSGYQGPAAETNPVLISKMDKLISGANVYDALEVSAIMLTDEEYKALPEGKDEEVFRLSRKNSRTLSYYGKNPDKYIFNDTIPVSPSVIIPSEDGDIIELLPVHVLFVYYFNPYIFPTIYCVTEFGTTTYYTKNEFELLNPSTNEYIQYVANNSTLYMYQHPIVQIDFKY